MAHPYLVADRFEDVTPEEAVRVNPKCDREVSTCIRPKRNINAPGLGGSESMSRRELTRTKCMRRPTSATERDAANSLAAPAACVRSATLGWVWVGEIRLKETPLQLPSATP